MAEDGGFGGVRELLADGHEIHFSVNFTKFTTSLRTPFAKSFTFPCKVSPTSWSFRMIFQQASIDSNVGCLVEIKRTDKSEIPMDAEYSMKMFPVPIIRLSPLIYRIESMQAGASESRIFDDVIPKDVLRGVGDGEILIHISFDVHGCHQEEIKRGQD